LAIAEDGTVARLPETTGYAEGAALPYGGVTALYFLQELAKVQPGERVLIVGASGGVGRLAVSLAKHLGAHVTGVCSADEELVSRLGADEVINYKQEHFADRGTQWDVIFDTTEGNHFSSFKKALTSTGRYLTLYVSLRVLAQMLISKFRKGPRALCGVAIGNPQLLVELGKLADTIELRDPIAARFPLNDASQAHALLEEESPHGSIVLDVTETSASGSEISRGEAA
jgi:NADPH:quinone reductase-like Zn-dependent oxidoreductase